MFYFFIPITYHGDFELSRLPLELDSCWLVSYLTWCLFFKTKETWVYKYLHNPIHSFLTGFDLSGPVVVRSFKQRDVNMFMSLTIHFSSFKPYTERSCNSVSFHRCTYPFVFFGVFLGPFKYEVFWTLLEFGNGFRLGFWMSCVNYLLTEPFLGQKFLTLSIDKKSSRVKSFFRVSYASLSFCVG